MKWLLPILMLAMFMVPNLSFAKAPKCPKGDKACAKRAAKAAAKKAPKKADKKKAKKTAQKSPAKKPKKKKSAEVHKKAPEPPLPDLNEPLPAPTDSSADAAGSHSPAPEAAPSKGGDLEDDIFPESSSPSAPDSSSDGLDEELPSE